MIWVVVVIVGYRVCPRSFVVSPSTYFGFLAVGLAQLVDQHPGNLFERGRGSEGEHWFPRVGDFFKNSKKGGTFKRERGHIN